MELTGESVAVVTGAASGIGAAMAQSFAAGGCAVVLADIDADSLAAVTEGIDGDVLAVVTDVSDAAAVEHLAEDAFARFGGVDVLCNNAGVSTFNPLIAQTLDDWRWVLGVNLWGVIHGVHTFLPRLLAQGRPAHIVNTSSLAGLASGLPQLGPYNVSKVGVVALSETLRMELAMSGAPIGVSVLCPGSTGTRIIESERNRPAHLGRRRAGKRARPSERLCARASMVQRPEVRTRWPTPCSGSPRPRPSGPPARSSISTGPRT